MQGEGFRFCFKSDTRASDVLQNFDTASARCFLSLQHIACHPEGERTERTPQFIQGCGTGLLSLLVGRMQSNLIFGSNDMQAKVAMAFPARSGTAPAAWLPLMSASLSGIGRMTH